MSKFPVELSDGEGQVDAINYLLSGPSGLGQNFAGFSSYETAYLTGCYRTPFTQPDPRNLYVPSISLSTSEFLDTRTLKFTFASTQASPPFVQGDPIYTSGVADDWYDDTWGTIGVLECTTTYCTVRLRSNNTIRPSSTGGVIGLTSMDTDISTDCNARVTTTGATDRVFISGQIEQTITSLVPGGVTNFTITVSVNRYSGFLNEDPVNPDYLFLFDRTVAQKVIEIQYARGPSSPPVLNTTNPIDVIFSTVIDQPTPGYYWYILEVNFTSDTTLEVTKDLFKLRSLSAQVVKE